MHLLPAHKRAAVLKRVLYARIAMYSVTLLTLP
jgi:hypothetical protein